jgi:hypothetical protein
MKILFLSLIFFNSLFSQGMYLSKENGFSLGFIYGGNKDGSKLGFTASYSLLGFIDLSYARSTFLDDENTSNFQNEYFLRAYILKEKIPIFLSGSFGYIYQKAESELWNNFPITVTQKGLAYEMGLHFSATKKDQNNPKVIASIIYRYFNSDQEIRVPTATIVDPKINRSLVFEAAIIHYFSQLGIIIGPRFVAENNFEYSLYGLNLTLMFKH